MKKSGIGFTALLLLALPAQADLFDLTDITRWTGSGSNEAALVVDWNVAGLASVAFGYRWDGAATAEDMLLAVAGAEADFYVRVGVNGGFGLPVFGLGLDLDQDGFGVSDGSLFTDGIAVTGTPANPEATATDTDDVYAEGWWNGFWGQYASTNSSPFEGGGAWVEGFGVSSQHLQDGDWAGLSFAADGWGFQTEPTSPTAVPEPGSLLLVFVGCLGLWAARRYTR